jgi:predicted RNase H-like nuclease
MMMAGNPPLASGASGHSVSVQAWEVFESVRVDAHLANVRLLTISTIQY